MVEILEDCVEGTVRANLRAMPKQDRTFQQVCDELIRLCITPELIQKTQFDIWTLTMRPNQTYYSYFALLQKKFNNARQISEQIQLPNGMGILALMTRECQCSDPNIRELLLNHADKPDVDVLPLLLELVRTKLGENKRSDPPAAGTKRKIPPVQQPVQSFKKQRGEKKYCSFCDTTHVGRVHRNCYQNPQGEMYKQVPPGAPPFDAYVAAAAAQRHPSQYPLEDKYPKHHQNNNRGKGRRGKNNLRHITTEQATTQPQPHQQPTVVGSVGSTQPFDQKIYSEINQVQSHSLVRLHPESLLCYPTAHERAELKKEYGGIVWRTKMLQCWATEVVEGVTPFKTADCQVFSSYSHSGVGNIEATEACGHFFSQWRVWVPFHQDQPATATLEFNPTSLEELIRLAIKTKVPIVSAVMPFGNLKPSLVIQGDRTDNFEQLVTGVVNQALAFLPHKATRDSDGVHVSLILKICPSLTDTGSRYFDEFAESFLAALIHRTDNLPKRALPLHFISKSIQF